MINISDGDYFLPGSSPPSSARRGARRRRAEDGDYFLPGPLSEARAGVPSSFPRCSLVVPSLIGFLGCGPGNWPRIASRNFRGLFGLDTRRRSGRASKGRGRRNPSAARAAKKEPNGFTLSGKKLGFWGPSGVPKCSDLLCRITPSFEPGDRLNQ